MISVSTDIISGPHNFGESEFFDDMNTAVQWLDNQVDLRFFDIKTQDNIVMLNMQDNNLCTATAILDNNITADDFTCMVINAINSRLLDEVR